MNLEEIRAALRRAERESKESYPPEPALPATVVLDSMGSIPVAPEGGFMMSDGSAFVEDQWRLEFKSAESDKVYFATIFRYESGVYRLICQWGRRGGTHQKKRQDFAVLEEARKVALKIVGEKYKKGYKNMGEA